MKLVPIKTKSIKMYKTIRVFIILLLLGLLIWALFLPKNVYVYSINSFTTVNNQWSQIIDNENVYIDNLDDYVQTDIGTPIILECTITQEMVEKSFVFYAEHQEVVVSIGNETVYSFYCSEEFEFFGSPGRTWVTVHITELMVGETFSLNFNSNFSSFHKVPTDIYLINESDIGYLQMNFLWFRNSIALLLIGLAVVTYINANLWKEKLKRRFYFALADVYIFVGLWLCSEINILTVWIGNSTVSSILSMIFIRVLPVLYYHLVSAILSYSTRETKIGGGLLWANLIISLILQFGFGISMLSFMHVHLVIVTICSVICMTSIFVLYKERENKFEYNYALYFSPILILAYWVECYLYINDFYNSQYLGVCLSIACITYATIIHILLVRKESNTDLEKEYLQVSYQNLHKKPLNQQINAHFLNNSLNTISALCKEDPVKADSAVSILAKYMHSYTNLIDASSYVPLEEELELLENYMLMQNMRFGDTIDYVIENNCIDVAIPSLSLQTLIENAINHGIRNNLYHGLIKIHTCYNRGMIQITVSDNGTGFNTTSLPNTQGVGLRNLSNRVHAMGGSITIESTIGKGTDVILTLPNLNTDFEE